MSTQQDIYVASFENRPPMLNKDNYVPWSSSLLRYAKSKPNGKLIYNSIINGPYVRRMIPEPGDPNLEVSVAETFHEQTDDELTGKEVKQMEADDQAIQIILMGLLEDIYAGFDSCETAQEIWLHVQQMMKGSDIGIQDKKAKLKDSNLKFLNNLQPEWRRHVTIVHQTKDLHEVDYTQLYYFLKYNQAEIAQPCMNLGQDRHMQMVGGNRGNQFRQYAGQNVGNQNGYNAVQNIGNQVVLNAVQNPGIQNVGNQNGLIVVPGIANPNANQIGNGNVVAARAEDGSAEVQLYDNCYNNDIFNMFTQEEQYTKLLEPIPKPHQVQQNDSNVISEVSSVEQGRGTVEQHPATVEETRAYFESLYNNLAIEVEKVNTVNRKLRETNADLTTELTRYKNQEKCFEISQEKYDKLERCYQKSVYQEQCLTKKINVLHLSSEFSDDTTLSVARKFLNEVKSTIVTLQRVVKQKMTLDIHNWSSSVHQEIHKIVKDENFPIVNQVDARVQNFEIQFLKEAAEFVRDFKSTNEAGESLARHKALKFEI
ncbi:hypothetical protein Tco_0447768 [Tanacetum coccineum]